MKAQNSTDWFRDTFEVGPLQCNCSIIGDQTTKIAWVVDPGEEAPLIKKKLDEQGFACQGILITHGHIDHAAGAGQLQELVGNAPVYLHPEEDPLLEKLDLQARLFGLPQPAPIQGKKVLIGDKQKLSIGNQTANVLFTPGHSPGGVCLHLEGIPVVLTQDTIFAGSIGRTDLFGGDHKTLITSIKERLLSFPDETVIVPGHGEESTIGQEKRLNPFINGQF